MPTLEGLRLKLLKYPRTGFAKIRKRKLNHKDFTIISNNCWGGMIYESYDLPKQSPTVGLFFMASDYIKFLSDLEGFLSKELSFLSPEDSKWKEEPVISEDRRYGSYPVGLLSNGRDDVEIFFLHYHSEKEAKEKWERRCKRINWNKLIVKFNDQNGCREEDIDAFVALPYRNKLFFTCKNWPKSVEWKKSVKGYCYIKQWPKDMSIMASYEPFGRSRYLNITEFLNTLSFTSSSLDY